MANQIEHPDDNVLYFPARRAKTKPEPEAETMPKFGPIPLPSPAQRAADLRAIMLSIARMDELPPVDDRNRDF